HLSGLGHSRGRRRIWHVGSSGSAQATIANCANTCAVRLPTLTASGSTASRIGGNIEVRVGVGLGNVEDEQRCVILPVILAECGDGFQNLFLDLVGVGLSILFEHEQQPAIAKFLALMAARFGHTIGEEHNAVAWLELNRADCEDLTGKNTEDNSAIAQA